MPRRPFCVIGMGSASQFHCGGFALGRQLHGILGVALTPEADHVFVNPADLFGVRDRLGAGFLFELSEARPGMRLSLSSRSPDLRFPAQEGPRADTSSTGIPILISRILLFESPFRVAERHKAVRRRALLG